MPAIAVLSKNPTPPCHPRGAALQRLDGGGPDKDSEQSSLTYGSRQPVPAKAGI